MYTVNFFSPVKLHDLFALELIHVDWLLKQRFNNSQRVQEAQVVICSVTMSSLPTVDCHNYTDPV